MDRKISLASWILLLFNTVVLFAVIDISSGDVPINEVPLFDTMKLVFWIIEALLLISSFVSLLYLDLNTRKEERKINS